MTSRWYQEEDQHCMLTASVILQCICIVIVEAFIHNSITAKNILISQVLITLTPLPHSLLSHSFPCLSRCLTHSISPPPPPPSLYSLPSLPSLTQFLLCHTHSPYSILCIPIHIILSLLATPSYLSYSLPHSFPHSLPCLSHSLCHSFSLAHFSASYFLTHSRLCIILSHPLHCLTHSLTHSLSH